MFELLCEIIKSIAFSYFGNDVVELNHKGGSSFLNKSGAGGPAISFHVSTGTKGLVEKWSETKISSDFARLDVIFGDRNLVMYAVNPNLRRDREAPYITDNWSDLTFESSKETDRLCSEIIGKVQMAFYGKTAGK